MNIVVCVKQIPSPEAAFSMFRIDENAMKIVPVAGVPLVMSPFDEQAVEAALRNHRDSEDHRALDRTGQRPQYAEARACDGRG
jgi:electron transfer flavoprotein alpha/beta subunit